MTRRVTIRPDAPDAAAVREAGECLRAGGLVAIPTETVYGLGANALDPAAVARIYEAKGRPAGNPLIVHVSSVEMAKAAVAEWPEVADRLAAAFWPGPLTLVLPRAEAIPAAVSANLPAVGVRMPAHPVAIAVIEAAGVPVAAPSANPYMGVSPTRAEHVEAAMADKLDMIVDGGPASVGLESTVLDLTGPVPTVLRLGGLDVARLREVLGTVEVHAGGATAPLPSPGLARRHYAPKALVQLLDGRAALEEELERLVRRGRRVGVLSFGPAPDWGQGIESEELPDAPAPYAARLYAAMHQMDAKGVRELLIEAPPATEPWAAVRDRLKRATAD